MTSTPKQLLRGLTTALTLTPLLVGPVRAQGYEPLRVYVGVTSIETQDPKAAAATADMVKTAIIQTIKPASAIQFVDAPDRAEVVIQLRGDRKEGTNQVGELWAKLTPQLTRFAEVRVSAFQGWDNAARELGRDLAAILVNAFRSLRNVPGETVASALELLRSRDPVGRARGAEALGRLNATDPAVVAALVKAVDDKTELRAVDGPAAFVTVGTMAARALVELGEVDGLVTMLRSSGNTSARVNALRALCVEQFANNPSVVTAVLEAMNGPWQLRQAAAQSIDRLLGKRAIEALIGHVGDGNAYVADAVKLSLIRITQLPSAVKMKADDWRKWWAENRESFMGKF